MTKLRHVLPLSLYFGYVLLLSYLILLPFSAANWTVFFPLAILAVIQGTLLACLFKWNRMKPSNIWVLSIACSLTAFLFFHIPFLPSCLIACLFTYFSSIGLERRNAAHLWLLFLISSTVAIFDYLFSGISHRPLLFLILLAELVLLNMFLITENRSENRYLPVLTAVFICAAAILSLIVSILKPFFLWIYGFLFNVLLKNALYVIANAYWALLNHFVTPEKSMRIKKALQSSNANQNSSDQFMPHIYPQHDYLYWIGLFLAAIVAVVLYLKFRKRNLHLPSAKESVSVTLTERSASFRNKRESKRLLGHLLPPRDPVRKAIFSLQKAAEKAGMGRRTTETLSDWLLRIEQGHPNQDLIHGYHKVRYGRYELSADEKKSFFASVDQVRRMIEASVDMGKK